MRPIVLFALAGMLFISCEPENDHSENSPKISVALQPLGPVDKSMLEAVKSSLNEVYQVNVIVLQQRKLPQEAYVQVKTPRYRADSLIGWLRTVRPDTVDHIIGLTESDISVTKRDASGQIREPVWKYEDWGVMGLGFRPGPSCIVSTFRIKSNNKSLFMERLKKVAVHELGHNFGLPHCPNEGCVMNDANESVKTIDQAKLGLCAKCREKI